MLRIHGPRKDIEVLAALLIRNEVDYAVTLTPDGAWFCSEIHFKKMKEVIYSAATVQIIPKEQPNLPC